MKWNNVALACQEKKETEIKVDITLRKDSVRTAQ